MLYMAITVQAQNNFNPPATNAVPVVENLHGVELIDNYQWLEDKENPDVKAWTKTQHEFTQNWLAKNAPAINGLREEIEAYVDRDVFTPVQLVGDRQFFRVRKKGEKQYKLYTKLNGQDVLLFDPLTIDPDGKAAITGIRYSFDVKKAAVGVQFDGAEVSDYYIIDTQTGKQISPIIKGLRGFSWTRSGDAAYIRTGTQQMLENQEPLKTYYHRLGTSHDEDMFLIAPKDAKDFAYIYDAKYADLTFVGEGDFYSTFSLKMSKKGSPAIEIYGSKEHEVNVTAIGENLYIKTNHNAPNWKIMHATVDNPTFENWTELIPEGETVIESFAVSKNHLYVQDKKDIVGRVKQYDLKGNFIKMLDLPETGTVKNLYIHKETNSLFVGQSSFTTPYTVYKTDAGNPSNWQLFYEQKTPVDASNIEGKIEFYTSKDGTRVPIMIIHRKGIELDGTNPTLLYGYGGFQISMSPNFVGLNAPFINRGGVYAIACLRGGGEYGEAWHKAGMLINKQNVYDDFFAAAEYLIEKGYTKPEKLAAYGRSNGGLLMGAIATQRPELFKAVVCGVPLLDMIRYHKFLIARYWIPEYGDPEVEADFKTLLKYSPYHNIKQGLNLPTMLVTAGENDTRVDPLHAKKFVAALQNNKGQENPILLHIDYGSGHGSGKTTEQTINDYDKRWRFIMNQLGM